MVVVVIGFHGDGRQYYLYRCGRAGVHRYSIIRRLSVPRMWDTRPEPVLPIDFDRAKPRLVAVLPGHPYGPQHVQCRLFVRKKMNGGWAGFDQPTRYHDALGRDRRLCHACPTGTNPLQNRTLLPFQDVASSSVGV